MAPSLMRAIISRVKILAGKADVREELDRLRAHVASARISGGR